MTRWELAAWLCENVRARRLRRIGEPVDQPAIGFDGLPADEQQPWLDVADAVLEFNHEDDLISRLQSLGADWMRYTTTIASPVDRDQMRRAIVVELRHEIAKLERECDYP